MDLRQRASLQGVGAALCQFLFLFFVLLFLFVRLVVSLVDFAHARLRNLLYVDGSLWARQGGLGDRRLDGRQVRVLPLLRTSSPHRIIQDLAQVMIVEPLLTLVHDRVRLIRRRLRVSLGQAHGLVGSLLLK